MGHLTALLCTVVATMVGCAGASTMVVLEEVAAGQFEVVVSQDSKHPTDASLENTCDAVSPQIASRGQLDSLAQHHYNLHYLIEGVRCAVALYGDHHSHPGTRVEWKDSADPWYVPGFLAAGKTVDAGMYRKHKQIYTVHVHSGAEDVQIRALNNSLIANIHANHGDGRYAGVLQDATSDGLTHKVLQSSGLANSTQNMVVLSAGYQDGEKEQFFRDVDVLVEFLQTDKDYPLSKYFPLTNVFGVFQASAQSGASNPPENIVIDNNLGCSYGNEDTAESQKSLICNRALAIALCDASPTTAGAANTLTVILVNSDIYGGTGTYQSTIRLATMYAAPLRTTDQLQLAKSLFFHEVGHGLTDLSDEYTTTNSEDGRNCAPPFSDLYDHTLPTCRKNCAGSLEDLGWQGWIDSKVLGEPTLGCYYNNFYKPGTLSGTPCLMEKVSEAPALCPVCVEASTLQLYNNGMKLTQPSCPNPEWSVIFIAQDEEARTNNAHSASFFSADKMYGAVANLNEQNQFTVRWELDGRDTGDTLSYYTITNAASLSVGEHNVTLFINDTTAYVLPKNRVPSMAASVTWKVVVLATWKEMVEQIGDADGNLASSQCDPVGLFARTLTTPRYSYYSQCNSPDQNCEFEYKTTLLEKPGDEASAVQAIEDWVFGLGGAMLGAGMCFFCLIYLCMFVWSDAPARVMEDCFSKPIKYIRRILIVINVILLLASVSLAILMGVMYAEVGAIAQVGLIFGMGTVCVLFLCAIVGITAAYSKRMPPLMFFGIMTMLVLLALLIICGTLFFIGFNSNNEGHQALSYIRNQWLDQVEDNPGMICDAQKKFECAGWDVPCSRSYSHAQCPESCEQTNFQYVEPCKVPVVKFAHYWMPIAATLILVVIYMQLCTALLVFMLFHILRKSQALDRHKQEILQEGPIEGLLSVARLHHGDKKAFRENLKKEFERFDHSGDGHLDKLEFSEFFRQTIGVELTEEQLDLLFALVDIRGLGLIRWQDWIEVIMKTTTLSVDECIDFLGHRKERAATMEDARRLDRLETIDDDPLSLIALDELNEISYDQAFTCYGRLDDGAFESTKDEFLALSDGVTNDEGQPVVTTEAYREHLMQSFKLNKNSRQAMAVIDGLPRLIDREGSGELTWTDWVATYFVRRDCYMELIKRQSKSRVARLVGERENSRMDSIRQRAQKSGIHLKRPSSVGIPPERDMSECEDHLIISDADFGTYDGEGTIQDETEAGES